MYTKYWFNNCGNLGKECIVVKRIAVHIVKTQWRAQYFMLCHKDIMCNPPSVHRISRQCLWNRYLTFRRLDVFYILNWATINRDALSITLLYWFHYSLESFLPTWVNINIPPATVAILQRKNLEISLWKINFLDFLPSPDNTTMCHSHRLPHTSLLYKKKRKIR